MPNTIKAYHHVSQASVTACFRRRYINKALVGSSTGRVMVRTTPLSPPELSGEGPTDSLVNEQQEKYQSVLDYFSQKDYRLPKVEDGELKENEKFWLVCTLF